MSTQHVVVECPLLAEHRERHLGPDPQSTLYKDAAAVIKFLCDCELIGRESSTTSLGLPVSLGSRAQATWLKYRGIDIECRVGVGDSSS
eukprot:6471497-Amphidinium_carterae.1